MRTAGYTVLDQKYDILEEFTVIGWIFPCSLQGQVLQYLAFHCLHLVFLYMQVAYCSCLIVHI
jgi:hypothetical protein